MNRKKALDRRSRRGHAVIESRDHCRPMDAIAANPRVQVIVGVRVVAEHQAILCWRTPVATDASEYQLGVFPLTTHVTVLGAAVDLPIFTTGDRKSTRLNSSHVEIS